MNRANRLNAIVAFFHTAPVLKEIFDELIGELAPGTAVRHTVRDDLLARSVACGAATPDILTEASHALLRETRANADMVIVTCSTIGAAADEANKKSSVPVFRIDRPMARQSVELGHKILVMATLRTTIEPTVDLIKSEALAAGRHPVIKNIVLDEARQLFLEGQREKYLACIAKGLRAAVEGADVIVLAQATMAAAMPHAGTLTKPVLTSPRLGLEGALKLIGIAPRRVTESTAE